MAGLSSVDRARIEAAVTAAETRTSAEFAVVVAQSSDHYAAYPLLWSAVLALVAGGAVAVALPYTSAAMTIAVQAAVFVVSSLVLHVHALRVRLVPGSVAIEHARRLAQLQFAALVQDRTHGDIGLLLFVSLAERHVEILVDRGIADRIPQSAWQGIVDEFVAAVRGRQLVEGVVTAVERCTSVLEQQFPAKPGARNEISDRVTDIV